MKAQTFINNLRSQGRFTFTIEDAENALELEKIPCLNALHRLKQSNQIASPAKGFYLVVPPEYQIWGCLPADMFISDLMKKLNLSYYVGFLSAAQYYGAAHQKPQCFQVVTTAKRRPIECGRIRIEFIANQQMASQPTRTFNTPAGVIKVASPEVLAADLVSSPQHAAGVSNVATILTELVETMDPEKLLELTRVNTELFWVQRLGYLLEFLDFDTLADVLFTALHNKKLHWVRLLSRAPYSSIERNKKWHIIVNTTVEPDE